jgi:hypothetical protein
LLHDIKTLISGPSDMLSTRLPYALTPDWEKEKVEMTLQQLEHRLHVLEIVQKEVGRRHE